MKTLQSNEHVGIFYYLINFGLFVLALFPTRYRCLADVRKLEVETNKRLTYLGSWKFLKSHKSNMNFSFEHQTFFSRPFSAKVFLIGRDKSRWTFWHCQCIKTISFDTDTQITHVTQTGRSTWNSTLLYNHPPRRFVCVIGVTLLLLAWRFTATAFFRFWNTILLHSTAQLRVYILVITLLDFLSMLFPHRYVYTSYRVSHP